MIPHRLVVLPVRDTCHLRRKIAGGIPRFWSCNPVPEADMIQVKEQNRRRNRTSGPTDERMNGMIFVAILLIPVVVIFELLKLTK
jgi:hypothetical protein